LALLVASATGPLPLPRNATERARDGAGRRPAGEAFYSNATMLQPAAASVCATATRVASVPRPPRIDRPTGRPSTVLPGILTWGTPVRPPCAARHRIRSR